MYDDTINLLKLEHIKDLIESVETRIEQDVFIIELTIYKQQETCPICHSKQVLFHEYKYKKIIHSISTSNKCIIRFHQRRYTCKQCGKSFGELNPFTMKHHNISHYTHLSILEHLKDTTHTFTDAAIRYHVSIQSVIDIFDHSVDAKRRTLPEIVCIDEVFTAKMNKYKYACVLFDFHRSKIIDVIATRRKHYLIDYFSRISMAEKSGVTVFVMDMWESYREAVKLSFPKAKIAVDSFHVIRTLNDVMRAIRIKVMNRYRLGKSGPEHDDSYYYMLKKFHYFFLKNYEDIFDGKIHIPKFKSYWHKSEIMDYLLAIDDDLRDVYRLKEAYREFNLTADYETCDDELNHLIHRFRNHRLLELRTFGKTLDRWKEEIKNSLIVFKTRRVSNGPIEATNSKIKTIIKTSTGIKSFSRLRNRIMYAINKDIPIKR
ncbi:MAG TPA: ISL3 family transposase [Acholeplasmataceae bacterium]|nr:ISL3 family transposase [Acholeplasmataceae bacterium]